MKENTSTSKPWWEGYPWRMIQTNLRQTDMADIQAKEYAAGLKAFGATVVTLNAAGIIASYPTALDCQTQSEYLTGDSLEDLIRECHAQGIRVIARTDFSKIRRPLFRQHPDWAYRDKDGNEMDYNGDVQTCPNGEYQQEKMLEILREVLTRYPFDGVFCNMSGFLVVDYSGIYHGPCHCENCKRKFKEMFGPQAEIPQRDDPRLPDYKKYAAFKGACLKAQRKKLVETVRAIRPDLAINNLDYIRTESNTEIGVAPWQYSASSNARLTAGPFHDRPADNASVDFLGFRYRDTSVSPACMALRQWQNLANAGSVSLYIMGRLDNHRDISSYQPTKRAFDFHKAHEELFSGLRSAARVLLVHRPMMARIDPEVGGWIKALTASHIPFDEVKQGELGERVLEGKELLILPDVKSLAPEQAALVDAFAKAGGTVLACCDTGIGGDPATLPCLGVTGRTGREKELMSSVFLVGEKEADTFPRCKEAPYIAIGPDMVRAAYQPETRRYLSLVPEHPFGPPERCYYDPQSIEESPAVTVSPYGRGKGIYIPWLPGTFYFREGHQNTLNFIQDILFSLCGMEELAPGLSPMVELTLSRHKTGGMVVQLVNGTGCFANQYFDPVPVREIRIHLPRAGTGARALNGGTVRVEKTDTGCTLILDELKEYEAIWITDPPHNREKS